MALSYCSQNYGSLAYFNGSGWTDIPQWLNDAQALLLGYETLIRITGHKSNNNNNSVSTRLV